MKTPTHIDSFYEKYGYKIADTVPGIGIYEFNRGVYYGVDIVVFDKTINVEIYENKYKSAGYAVRIVEYNSKEDIAKLLFNSFFTPGIIHERLRNQYNNYIDKRSLTIGGKYEYIPCLYTIDNVKFDDKGIINRIASFLFDNGPQLVIIEAAAGYGKTSTAYEIMNDMLSNQTIGNPIFAELARNRSARIFKYVLLDEIDSMYPTLNSGLVKTQIQEGLIPVIIDGFDELLKVNIAEGRQADFEDAQSMLDTIAEMLVGQAKIILTTRRTAIFTDDGFEAWINRCQESCSFGLHIIELEAPSTNDWIGRERSEILKKTNFPLESLSNPVLLSYIRNMPKEKVEEEAKAPDGLVESYFSFMFERERERQVLPLTSSEQKEVLTAIAKGMVLNNSSALDRSFFKLLIEEHNIVITLQNAIDRSGPSEVQKLDELIDKIINHAFFDRISTADRRIGFLNQFLFGYFIAHATINSDEEFLLELAVTPWLELGPMSFSTKSFELRKRLHDKVMLTLDTLLPAKLKITIDDKLIKFLSSKLYNDTINSLSLDQFDFSTNTIETCTFLDTVFTNCKFDFKNFINVNFISCSFHNCYFENVELLRHEDFIGCNETGTKLFEIQYTDRSITEQHDETYTDLEIKVLEQFWRPGRAQAEMRKKVRTLFAGFSSKEKNNLPDAIKKLQREKLINIDQNDANLIIENIGKIAEILGRN
ncbi:hypothetical protein EPN96_09455 [bacterium]|nr:MAG: hypothetical protein EPN96_09455 [bacterium]